MKEFSTAAELRAHYRDVFSRRPAMVKPPPRRPKVAAPAPPPEPEPEPPLPPVPVIIPLVPSAVLKKIARIVCEHYAVEWNLLCSRRQVAVLVRPRQVFAYVAHRVAKQSYSRIAKALNRDHSTIIHGDYKIASLAMTDPSVAQDIAIITRRYEEREQWES